mgnify:CR=1 FL=1
MTDSQKKKLDKEMDNFGSFYDFHKFAYKHDIEFDNDEWVEYSNRLKRKILTEKNKPTKIYINTSGLILPNTERLKK